VATWCGLDRGLALRASVDRRAAAAQTLRHREQKKKYLPRLAKGAISAFALTEPGVGSDPAKMETTAVKSPDGKGWIINGEKLWCHERHEGRTARGDVQDRPEDGQGEGKETDHRVHRPRRIRPVFSIEHRCQFMGFAASATGC